ncbi:M1 family metallopeptidase [Pedobacter sp. UYEF25]
MRFLVAFALIVFGFLYASAQVKLPIDPVFQKTYTQKTRDMSGKPGINYWQNHSDYKIKVNFNPDTRLLNGHVDITYSNNSPNTLNQIWFKLYPNLYKKGTSRKSKIADADLGDGVSIQQFKVNGKAISNYQVDGTNMTLSVPSLLPKSKMTFSIDYSYVLNRGSHIRTGQVDEGSYFIAYFFPRIAVYDDVDGWNKYPYNGAEEFYNDFDHFKSEITVPKNFAVWATGDLLNANEVYQPQIVNKIKLAERVDSVVDVINDKELKQQLVTAQNASNTFKFEASNVTDFVFALSDHYLWKSTSLVVDSVTKRRTRVDAAFNSTHKDYYEVIDFARKTVHAMSYIFPKWPFPYQHETIFDGLDQMEYPMMVNDNPVENRTDAITLTDHEIFHTMFPFYMGINETKYGWMDEGWATIGEWTISSMIDSTIVDEYGIQPTAASSGSRNDTPIMTLTPNLSGSGAFTNSYPKPGLGYLYIKDYLGEVKFNVALHNYIKNWHGKHPMPFDFFYSINAGAGENLNWFWKRWFFDGGITDMAITAVNKTADGYSIAIENKSLKPLPVDLTLKYQNGDEEELHYTIAVWKNAEKTIATIKTQKKLKKVVLGSAHVPDKNKHDNIFSVN